MCYNLGFSIFSTVCHLKLQSILGRDCIYLLSVECLTDARPKHKDVFGSHFKVELLSVNGGVLNVLNCVTRLSCGTGKMLDG